MKKTILAVCSGILITGAAMAQPVSDRAVIPLGVTLVQILRIHVINGGNIEFVFNDIGDYKNGIENAAGSGFYTSQVQIASSTNWALDMGAEELSLIGTDNPLNTLALNNVGFTCLWTGTYLCCGGVGLNVDNTGFYTNNITALGAPNIANGLARYIGVGSRILFTKGALGNGGDVVNNAFNIQWQVGTAQLGTYAGVGTSPMNLFPLINQAPMPNPDRYSTNVFLELQSIP